MIRTPRVLLHAPDSPQVQALAALLASGGFAVEAVASLAELRNAWDRGDVAVVDLTGPDGRRQRLSEATLHDLRRVAAAVPLIVLTHGGRRAVEALGAVALPMPFDTGALLAAVRSLVYYLYDEASPAEPDVSPRADLVVAAA